jgi:hypothetical protein
VSFVTVVVEDPVFVFASVTHTRIVFAPSTRVDACTVEVVSDAAVAYVPVLDTIPVEQSVPPTRTE